LATTTEKAVWPSVLHSDALQDEIEPGGRLKAVEGGEEAGRADPNVG
jgi:hypothetical protein